MKESGVVVLQSDAHVEQERVSSRSRRIQEEFAVLMTTCAHVVRDLAPAQVAWAHSSPPSSLAPTGAAEIWRRVDGPVTVAPSAAAPTSARFVTQVVHEELGAIEITVERKSDSVRVLFEVGDAVARVALETERAALLASLHAAGVPVASVVVAVRAGGTALASKGFATRPRRTEGDAPPEHGDAGGRSGLDLVG